MTVSDFITAHYYDPNDSSGARYSFGGNIQAPHTVLEGGYVSFGNPVDNHWYQIMVGNGQTQVRDLGVIQSTNGRSLRELVDFAVRKARQKERYRIKPAMIKASGRGGRIPASQDKYGPGKNAAKLRAKAEEPRCSITIEGATLLVAPRLKRGLL